jgi:hypothetical protein
MKGGIADRKGRDMGHQLQALACTFMQSERHTV